LPNIAAVHVSVALLRSHQDRDMRLSILYLNDGALNTVSLGTFTCRLNEAKRFCGKHAHQARRLIDTRHDLDCGLPLQDELQLS
jgi:hypothetical protein